MHYNITNLLSLVGMTFCHSRNVLTIQSCFSLCFPFFFTTSPNNGLGFIPYPSGTIIFRNGAIRHLMAVDAPYAFNEFDYDSNEGDADAMRDMKNLGQFTLEVGGWVGGYEFRN